ncbi:MAG: transketolase [Verrucomicrobia bacterium]|nr:transketolase [Verrucomicrobiota bacterium]
MRKTSLDAVYELAKRDKRVVFIGSDLGIGTLKQFKAEMPERFFMEGVSEAHLVTMAAGLALEGKVVYINTIATFLTRRCFEQVCLDLSLHHTNVRLIGSGGGVVYAPLGPTHEAIEDIAIFRTLPRMTIVAPCDAEEMKRLMPQTLDWDGPMYIRLGKGGDAVVSRPELGFQIGKALLVRDGTDALIVTTGITLQPALAAAAQLGQKGIQAGVLHMHTVKPFDTEALITQAARVPAILSIEEHTVIGGLGSAVAETLAEANFITPKRFKRIGIPDVFPDKYGSQATLLARYGITAEGAAAEICRLLGR